MLYIHNLQENLSLKDILENTNHFFIKTEDEKDLITNINNNKGCIFFIDYKDIEGNTKLNKAVQKNKENSYIAIVSHYIHFAPQGFKVLKKPYSIQDIINIIKNH